MARISPRSIRLKAQVGADGSGPLSPRTHGWWDRAAALRGNESGTAEDVLPRLCLLTRQRRFLFWLIALSCHCEPVRRLVWQSVGALRKHAGGMFLASDLGGYAAVASIWFCTARQKWVAEGRPRPRGDETPLTLTSDPHTGRPPSLPPRRRLRRWSAGGRTSPVRHRRQTRRHSRSGYPPPPHNSRRQCSPWR